MLINFILGGLLLGVSWVWSQLGVVSVGCTVCTAPWCFYSGTPLIRTTSLFSVFVSRTNSMVIPIREIPLYAFIEGGGGGGGGSLGGKCDPHIGVTLYRRCQETMF